MPKFEIEVRRSFSSQHVAKFKIEAANKEEAQSVAKYLVESGEFDPADDYEEQESGYDDASAWQLDVDQIDEIKAGDVRNADSDRVYKAAHYPLFGDEEDEA